MLFAAPSPSALLLLLLAAAAAVAAAPATLVAADAPPAPPPASGCGAAASCKACFEVDAGCNWCGQFNQMGYCYSNNYSSPSYRVCEEVATVVAAECKCWDKAENASCGACLKEDGCVWCENGGCMPEKTTGNNKAVCPTTLNGLDIPPKPLSSFEDCPLSGGCWGEMVVGVTLTIIGSLLCVFAALLGACCKENRCHWLKYDGAYTTHAFSWSNICCLCAVPFFIAGMVGGGDPVGWGFLFTAAVVYFLFGTAFLVVYILAWITKTQVWEQFWHSTGRGHVYGSNGTHATIEMGYHYWSRENITPWHVCRVFCLWGCCTGIFIAAIVAFYPTSCE